MEKRKADCDADRDAARLALRQKNLQRNRRSKSPVSAANRPLARRKRVNSEAICNATEKFAMKQKKLQPRSQRLFNAGDWQNW